MPTTKNRLTPLLIRSVTLGFEFLNRSPRVIREFYERIVSRGFKIYSDTLRYFFASRCFAKTLRANGLLIVVFLSFPIFCRQETTFSLMINPAGDAQHMGRKVDDSFERGVTLQFAEELKKVLEEKFPAIRVVLTRFPGETVQPMQNATFANRLSIDLYLSLHCFQEANTVPTMYVYYLTLGDDYVLKPSPLAFYQYDQAHMLHKLLTLHWAKNITDLFSGSEYRRIFTCRGPFGIPCAPLMGIIAPAIMLECGLKNKNDWHMYIDPIVAGLEKICSSRS